MSPEGYDPQEVVYGDTYKPRKPNPEMNPQPDQTSTFESFAQAVGMLRQFINEDRVGRNKLVTSEDIHHWLDGSHQADLQKAEQAAAIKVTTEIRDRFKPGGWEYEWLTERLAQLTDTKEAK